MANVENVELRASLCTICDWRSSSFEDQSASNINNLEKRKVSLLARALREKLPKNFRHVICKPQPNEYAEPDVCVLRINCKSQDEVDTWVSNYSVQSGFKWDKQTRLVSLNRKVKELYRCKYVCHEPGCEESLSAKQTATQPCPASITVVIKSGNSGVVDEHINSFPTVVRLRGDHSCFCHKSLLGATDEKSSQQLPGCDIRSGNVLSLQTASQTKENGTGEAKKVINAKKDLQIGARITSTNNNSSHLTKKNSLKKDPVSCNGMDIAVTDKVEAVNQEGKISVNYSLDLSKENTSRSLLKGITMSKESLLKVASNKAKHIHGKPSCPEAKNVSKKPLILNKGNRIVGPTNVIRIDVSETEVHTEKKPPTYKCGKREDITVTATMKAPNSVTAKRKRDEISPPNGKMKKPCVIYARRVEGSIKKSPKKIQEVKTTPVVQKKDCQSEMVNKPKILETYLQLHPKPPPKVVTVKLEPIPEINNFGSLTAKFDALFSQSHEPATALATHIVDLQLNEGSNWRNVACPDLAWCQSRFDKVVNEPRITTPQTTLSTLAKFAGQCASTDLCCVESLADGGFVGVVVTELMQRNVDTNPNATGINYVLPYLGTTSQLFLVMCDSEGGGLPLAIMITSDLTPRVLAPAVRLLSKHSRVSPRLWLVPDVPVLRTAFLEGFPGASVGLSLTLLLRDSWQFALRETSRVPETHQVLLYQYMEHLIGCASELALLYQLKVALTNPVKGLETFCEYLNGIYARRNEWAAYLRDPAFREAALLTEIAVTKASVFSRLHDFDTVHLVHFALTRLDKWYENRVQAIQSRTHVDQPITNAPTPTNVKLTTLSDGVKLVQFANESVEHVVNDIVGICSCLKGNAGWCCHQLAVSLDAKADDLPGAAVVVSLLPSDPVQVDTSMPEIFPSSIVEESRKSGMWGQGTVEGKRVRKPKLKVDLGAFGPPKKHKGEKKEKKEKAEIVSPVSGSEFDEFLAKDCINVHVVKKVANKGKPASKLSLINGFGDEDYAVRKSQAAKKSAAKQDAKKRHLSNKRTSLPGDVTEIEIPSVKETTRRHSSDSVGSQKTVHFSPQVEKRVTSPSKEHETISKMIKAIKRDLARSYALNPSLKDKICDLYQAMQKPVTEPHSILKQSLLSAVEREATVEQDVIAEQEVTVEQKVTVEVVSVPEVSDVGAVKVDEEIGLAEEVVPAYCDVNLNECYVSLNAFDVEKYRMPDGSYSLVT